MFDGIRWENRGQHCDVSDDLNNLKERLIRLRQNRPVFQMPTPCYGRRCGAHHPVTIGQVQTQELELMDVVSAYPPEFQWKVLA